MDELRARRKQGWLFMLFGWALAFFMVTAFYHGVLKAQRNPNNLSVMSMQDGELVLEKNRGGHYMVEGTINGRVVTFLVDTGASRVALSERLANEIGLEKKTPGTVETAAGTTPAWSTDIAELQIGFIRFDGLRGVIIPGLDDDMVLLGMNALGSLEIVQSGDTLALRPPR